MTQKEAEWLIQMEKYRVDERMYQFPVGGGERISVPLSSPDGSESFLLDISRGSINLKKIKYQNRARKIIVLVRLDIGGAPHRNPNGKEIRGPHLHIYREGYGDKYAKEIPDDWKAHIDNPGKMLDKFMEYCHITRPPRFLWSLF